MTEGTNDAAVHASPGRIVVARRFDDDAVPEDLADWCGGEVATVNGLDSIKVPTNAGIELARPGDWIVRVNGKKFARVSRDEFAARFEPHDTEPAT